MAKNEDLVISIGKAVDRKDLQGTGPECELAQPLCPQVELLASVCCAPAVSSYCAPAESLPQVDMETPNKNSHCSTTCENNKQVRQSKNRYTHYGINWKNVLGKLFFTVFLFPCRGTSFGITLPAFLCLLTPAREVGSSWCSLLLFSRRSYKTVVASLHMVEGLCF